MVNNLRRVSRRNGGGHTLKVTIIGAGYVGLVTGVCLAELGNDVTCLDVIAEKVASINRGQSVIYEEGLQEALARGLAKGTFRANMDPGKIAGSEVTFICVGTPSRSNGGLDLKFVKEAAVAVGKILRDKEGYHVVVVKSTVTPGTCEKVVRPILEKASGKRSGIDFGLAMNPEFLKEGMAIFDFMHPDRIVVGGDERARSKVLELYEGFSCPKLQVSLTTAEMIKVAANSFLATKISFVNEMGNLCKEMGIDFRQVAEGIGHDARIGNQFLRAGCGFGGSCFPKDVKGIRAEARRLRVRTDLLDAALQVNRRQPGRLIELLGKHRQIKGGTFAVLGLAFKPNTDDVREASSIRVVEGLLRRGAKVRVYDPKAMDNFKRIYPDIAYCSSARQCLEGADAAIIVTEWAEFADPSLYGDMLVIDGRGVTKTSNYEGICW
jgi:UDPglucose 6-dehydrogenase